MTLQLSIPRHVGESIYFHRDQVRHRNPEIRGQNVEVKPVGTKQTNRIGNISQTNAKQKVDEAQVVPVSETLLILPGFILICC